MNVRTVILHMNTTYNILSPMVSTERVFRVGVFTKPLDNWKSGSGHHLDELMKHVLDLHDDHFEFTFIHYKKSDNPIYSRVHELLIPRNPLSASAVLRKEQFDVVHYAPLSIFAPIQHIASKKVATVHGVEEALFPQGYTAIQRLHFALILPAYMRRMDRIATVSETSKKYFVQHYAIPANHVFITTNGLGAEYRILSEAEKKLPDELGITKRFIFHISRYSARKNPITVIKGFARFIRETNADYQLVCAGTGWNCSEIQQLTEKEGIREQVITPGFISESLVVKLLNNAEAFVFPSFAEGFGMPNIEAMACGCPVITSNSFAIPEVVGDAAIIMQQADSAQELASALSKITNNPDQKKALVQRGFKQIQQYTWNNSAKALLQAYGELCNGIVRKEYRDKNG